MCRDKNKSASVHSLRARDEENESKVTHALVDLATQ